MLQIGSSKALLHLLIHSPSVIKILNQHFFFVLVFLLWILIPLVPLVMFLFLLQVIPFPTSALAKVSKERWSLVMIWSIVH